MNKWLNEKLCDIRMRRSEKYDYLKWVNYDPEAATKEDVEAVTALASDLRANKDLDARDVLTMKGWSLLVVLGACLVVLPICWVAEMLATHVFGFAYCSAPYWGTYVGTLLIIGIVWCVGWLWCMEKIKNVVMEHRARRLDYWVEKAYKLGVLPYSYVDSDFPEEDFVPVDNP